MGTTNPNSNMGTTNPNSNMGTSTTTPEPHR
jgi:hypothetical protein